MSSEDNRTDVKSKPKLGYVHLSAVAERLDTKGDADNVREWLDTAVAPQSATATSNASNSNNMEHNDTAGQPAPTPLSEHDESLLQLPPTLAQPLNEALKEANERLLDIENEFTRALRLAQHFNRQLGALTEDAKKHAKELGTVNATMEPQDHQDGKLSAKQNVEAAEHAWKLTNDEVLGLRGDVIGLIDRMYWHVMKSMLQTSREAANAKTQIGRRRHCTKDIRFDERARVAYTHRYFGPTLVRAPANANDAAHHCYFAMPESADQSFVFMFDEEAWTEAERLRKENEERARSGQVRVGHGGRPAGANAPSGATGTLIAVKTMTMISRDNSAINFSRLGGGKILYTDGKCRTPSGRRIACSSLAQPSGFRARALLNWIDKNECQAIVSPPLQVVDASTRRLLLLVRADDRDEWRTMQGTDKCKIVLIHCDINSDPRRLLCEALLGADAVAVTSKASELAYPVIVALRDDQLHTAKKGPFIMFEDSSMLSFFPHNPKKYVHSNVAFVQEYIQNGACKSVPPAPTSSSTDDTFELCRVPELFDRTKLAEVRCLRASLRTSTVANVRRLYDELRVEHAQLSISAEESKFELSWQHIETCLASSIREQLIISVERIEEKVMSSLQAALDKYLGVQEEGSKTAESSIKKCEEAIEALETRLATLRKLYELDAKHVDWCRPIILRSEWDSAVYNGLLDDWSRRVGKTKRRFG